MDIFNSKIFSRAILLELPIKDLQFYKGKPPYPVWSEILQETTFWLKKCTKVKTTTCKEEEANQGMSADKIEKWKKLFEVVECDDYLSSLALEMLIETLANPLYKCLFSTPLYSIMRLKDLKDIVKFTKYFFHLDMVNEFLVVPKLIEHTIGFIYTFDFTCPESNNTIKFEYYIQFQDGRHYIKLHSRYVDHTVGLEHLIPSTVLLDVVENVHDYVIVSE